MWTGIFGPIRPNTKVALTPGEGTGVEELETNYVGESLIDELLDLAEQTPKPENSTTVKAKWVSSRLGGALPGCGYGRVQRDAAF